MAGERSDLGKIFITPGGDYDATVTYETLTMVKYNNSLYLTLRTVTGVTPSDDRVNYLLMAQGFTATRLESITATDVQGLVTEPGDEMPAQTLINAIADRVANQLVTNSALTDILGDYILKSAIANNLSITEEGKVLDARQGKALNDALGSYLKKSGIILGNVSTYSLAADTPRTINQEGSTGSPTLDNGFYILISETSTNSNSFSGRTLARFTGSGVVGMNTFVPPTVSGLHYAQLIQFIYVTSGSATIMRSYYDTVATGANHIWNVYKVIAI